MARIILCAPPPFGPPRLRSVRLGDAAPFLQRPRRLGPPTLIGRGGSRHWPPPTAPTATRRGDAHGQARERAVDAPPLHPPVPSPPARAPLTGAALPAGPHPLAACICPCARDFVCSPPVAPDSLSSCRFCTRTWARLPRVGWWRRACVLRRGRCGRPASGDRATGWLDDWVGVVVWSPRLAHALA